MNPREAALLTAAATLLSTHDIYTEEAVATSVKYALDLESEIKVKSAHRGTYIEPDAARNGASL